MHKFGSWRYLIATAVSCAALLGTINPTEAAEVSRRTFSIHKSTECSTSPSCFLDFGAVPAKHRYEITNVSCYLVIGNVNGRVLYWQLSGIRNGVHRGRIHLRAHFLGTSSSAVHYNATEQGLIVAPAGTQLTVSMTRDSSTAGGIPHMNCTIGGQDITLG